MGPFSRIINSSLCPAWPTEKPRPPPQGTPGPLSSTPPAIPLRQSLPLPCAASGSPGQYPMCCRHGNLHVPSRLRLREVGVWAIQEEVQWPGIKGHRSVLGLGGFLGGWGWGPVTQKSHLAGGHGAEKSDSGRPGRGALPVNWAQQVSPGLKAREMWIQILHPHLLFRSPGDHHLTPEFSILTSGLSQEG